MIFTLTETALCVDRLIGVSLGMQLVRDSYEANTANAIDQAQLDPEHYRDAGRDDGDRYRWLFQFSHFDSRSANCVRLAFHSQTIIVRVAVIAFTISLTLSLPTSRSILVSIKEYTRLSTTAAESDLTVVPAQSSGEFGMLNLLFAGIIGMFRGSLLQIRQSTGRLVDAVDAISNLSRSATESVQFQLRETNAIVELVG